MQEVIQPAAHDHIHVDGNSFIDLICAGIGDGRPDRLIAGHAPSPDETGLDQRPRSVTNCDAHFSC
jgi:hypothetical protein